MARSIWTMTPLEKSASTRQRLMDAAAVLFYEHGFHAVGLDRILADVGVTKTTFYNYFESRDELIVGVLQHRDQHDMDQLHAELARRGGSARERILDVFDILDEWFRDEGFRGCLFINAAAQFPNPNDPVHVAAAHHGQNLMLAFQGLGREAGVAEPELLARQLCMLAAAAITARQVNGDPQAARIAHDMAAVLLERALGSRGKAG